MHTVGAKAAVQPRGENSQAKRKARNIERRHEDSHLVARLFDEIPRERERETSGAASLNNAAIALAKTFCQ
jgi:hypothetical protein